VPSKMGRGGRKVTSFRTLPQPNRGPPPFSAMNSTPTPSLSPLAQPPTKPVRGVLKPEPARLETALLQRRSKQRKSSTATAREVFRLSAPVRLWR
jgi:hypothetical protein